MAELIIRVQVPDQAHLDPAYCDPEELAAGVVIAYNDDLRADGSGDSQVALAGAEWAPARLGLIGREDFLNNWLTKRLHGDAAKSGDHTSIRDMHRGRWFEIRTDDGHVWRVEVTLDRIESEKEKN
jgi:hypothetical protein